MSVQVDHLIALHLKSISNLSLYCTGKYHLQFHIFRINSNPTHQFAIPINLIEKQSNNQLQPSFVQQTTYLTRTFILKPGQNKVDLDEICLFKHQFELFDYENIQKDLMMEFYCELVLHELEMKNVVSSFQGKIFGPNGSQFLVFQFYTPHACKVTGSLHSCIYNYSFKSNQQIKTFEAYCLNSKQVQYVLEYMIKSLQETQKRLSDLLGQKQIKLSSIQGGETQQLKEKILNIKVDNVPLDQYHEIVIKIGRCKKRKKIFQIAKEQNCKNQKIMPYVDQLEKILHNKAQKIYYYWNTYLRQILEDPNSTLFNELYSAYQIKFQKKIGQYIIKFKGSWDIDIYSKESKQRATMIHQLRNPPLQHFKESNQFHFSSVKSFTHTQPIFFQQQADNFQMINKKTPQKLIIFLVHGLGACRVDMENLRCQLKKYLGDKVQIIVSTANQGKTQGSLSSMSLRLANEVEYHIGKTFNKNIQLSFIGHSMGGIIIRGALPLLKKYKDQMYSLLTLSSPHIGYLYSNSKLIDAGLWIVNSLKRCESILQLCMQDEGLIQNTYLYHLSKSEGLNWFSKVTLMSSKQDSYVPYHSARIQKSQQCIEDYKKKLQKGIKNVEMIENILNSIKGKLTRIDVDFQIQNIDSIIGRTAHVHFIKNIDMLKILSVCANRLLF